MKKFTRILAFCIGICLTFGLVGCGGNRGDDDIFGDNGSNGKVVRYYSFNDSETNRILSDAIKNDFNKKYPDITIQLELSPGSFYTNLLTDFASGTEADVFNMEPGEIYPFLNAGYLEPLDSYFEKSEIVKLDDIWDINKEAYAYDTETKQFGEGNTYAVLKDWTTDAMLMYNRDLFTEEQLALIEKDENNDGISDPLTFDEFETLCDNLLIKNGSSISQYSFLPGLAEAKVLAQFLTNAGLSWFDPVTYESTFDTKEVQDVLKWYYDILGANEVNNTGSTFYPMFATGQVAMVMGGLYCIDSYGLDDMNLGIAYPPVKEEGMESKPYTTGCVGFAISSRSKSKDAAFKFVEWYLDYFGEKDAKECNNFPAVEKYAEEYMLNPEFNTNPVRLEATKSFYTSLSKAVVIDRNPYCSQASLEAIQMMYTGEYLEGAMTFEEYWDTYDYEINKIVEMNKAVQG